MDAQDLSDTDRGYGGTFGEGGTRWRANSEDGGDSMQFRVGFEMVYQCPQPTPMVLALSIHYSRAFDLVRPDRLVTNPSVPVTAYRDLFGNWCSRIVAPQGRFVLSTDALVNDSGAPDVVAPWAMQAPVEKVPESTLVYLPRQPLLRDRPAVRGCLAAFRLGPSRLGARAGDL